MLPNAWIFAIDGGPEILTSLDAAQELGMSCTHLERLLSEGRIRGHQETNGQWTVDRVEVDRILDQRAADRRDRVNAEAADDERRRARAARTAETRGVDR